MDSFVGIILGTAEIGHTTSMARRVTFTSSFQLEMLQLHADMCLPRAPTPPQCSCREATLPTMHIHGRRRAVFTPINTKSWSRRSTFRRISSNWVWQRTQTETVSSYDEHDLCWRLLAQRHVMAYVTRSSVSWHVLCEWISPDYIAMCLLSKKGNKWITISGFAYSVGPGVTVTVVKPSAIARRRSRLQIYYMCCSQKATDDYIEIQPSIEGLLTFYRNSTWKFYRISIEILSKF